MIWLVSFCKIWVPWTFHALSKNLLELRKPFPMSISKGIIQTIQELSHLLPVPTADDNPSRPLVRSQTCHPGPQQLPGAPGLLPPSGPPSTGGVQTPPGKPQGIWPGNSLQGSSAQAMSGFGQGHSCDFRNYTGIILALCLRAVESTAGIYSTMQTKNSLPNAFLQK